MAWALLAGARLPAQTYTNPVIFNAADPGVYFHAANSNYYVYATDWQFHRSADLVNWTAIGNPLADSGMFWAPEVFKRPSDGFLYMFYTLNTRLRVAKVSSPAGPFNPIALDLTGRWSIDSTYLRDDDGREYVYWNEGGTGVTSGIWVGDLNGTLTAVSNAQHCFGYTDVGDWVTGYVVEAPNMLKHGGTYYLVFSGNGTGPDYKLGYATAPSPRGPWTMYAGNPILAGNAAVSGPGHCSFTRSADGSRLLIVYHGAIVGGGAGRHTRVDLAEFIPDPGGGPDILDVIGPTSAPQPYPLSGTPVDPVRTVTDNLLWTDPMTWSDGTADHAGRHYVVLDGFRVRTPGGTAAASFRGDSLEVAAGGTILWKGSGVITIGSLWLNGGELFHSAVGDDQVARVAGQVEVLTNSTLRGPMSSTLATPSIADPRQLEIQSSMTGPGGVAIATAKTASNLTHRGYVVYSTVAKDYRGDTVIGGRDSSGAGGLSDFGATLRLEVANALPFGAARGNVIVQADGTLNLNGRSAAVNGLSGGGWVANLAGTGITGAAVPTGAVAGAATLSVGFNNQSGTFSGVMLNNLSLTKVGTAALTLGGANTYSGTTTVSNGLLRVTGSLAGGAVHVVGGTLGGTGLIRGPVTVHAGGTLSPGTSLGTLNVSNTLALAAGGTTFVEVNAQTLACDRVQGITVATYGGALVVTNLAGTLAAGQSFPLFIAAGRNGTFASITPPPGPALGWVFNPTNGTLSVVAAQPPEVTNFSIGEGGFTLSGRGHSDTPYRIMATTNLALPFGAWTPVATGVFSGGEFRFTDPSDTPYQRRFYRGVSP